MICKHDEIITFYPVEGKRVPAMWACKKCWQKFVPMDQLIKEVAEEQDRCCAIVFGQCDSDNVAQRTVDAIKDKTCQMTKLLGR